MRDADLDRFSKQGDACADESLRSMIQHASSNGTPELAYLGQLVAKLGRWDPSKVPDPLEAGLDPIEAAYVNEPFIVSKDELAVIERAQLAYLQRHGLAARIVLATYSLPVIYVHSESALTLAGTGRLLVHVRDRLEDTQAFIDDVMKPGNLQPGAAGQRWIRKVRLTHAAVRAMRAQPKSGAAVAFLSSIARARMLSAVDDTVRLDQVELAFVLQTFSWVIVDGLRRLGKGMNAHEADDHVAAWSVIGGMMGIESDLRPSRIKDARALFLRIRDRALEQDFPYSRIPNDKQDSWMSGPLLAAAWITMLVQIQRERTPAWLRPWLARWPWLDEALQQISRVLIRQYCGTKASRRLRITRAPFAHWLICQVAVRLLDLDRLAGDMDPSGTEFSAAWM